MTTRSLLKFGSLLITSCLLIPTLGSAADKAAAKAPSVTVAQASKIVSSNASGVSLIATAADADGKITSYRWKQTSGPSVTLSDIYTDWASFTAPATKTPVVLTFEVTVTDNDNLTANASVIVTVLPNSTAAVAGLN